jgi:hypothetical protein
MARFGEGASWKMGTEDQSIADRSAHPAPPRVADVAPRRGGGEWRAWYSLIVDPLRRDDIERARATPPGEKLRQALEMMRVGIEMKRARLRAEDPLASDAQIQQRLWAWLAEER